MRVARLDDALDRLDTIADPRAREMALAAVQAVMELYGEGLSRVVEHADAACARTGDSALADAFGTDELVSHLLLLHGLHPTTVEDRVRGALEGVRPYLRSHGGNVELLGIQDGIVQLQLEGSCHGCPASSLTLRTAVEDAIRTAAPEVVRIEAGGVSIDTSAPPAPALVSLSRARAKATDTPSAHATAETEERCGLCNAVVDPEHRHLLDTVARRLVCACRACALLFDHHDTGGRHYRLVPDRYRRVSDFALNDAAWSDTGIPVDMAFFFHDTAAERVVALYPGAAGVVEAHMVPHVWSDLAAANPVLAELEADVEALLINRTNGVREYWLVPVDACYALAGIIRKHWKGLAGGDDVWTAIATFFTELESRATVVRHDETGANTPVELEEIAS